MYQIYQTEGKMLILVFEGQNFLANFSNNFNFEVE